MRTPFRYRRPQRHWRERIPDERLLADLRRVVEQTGQQSRAAYVRHGRYDAGLFWRRFGSFPEACRAAGLPAPPPSVHPLSTTDSCKASLEEAKRLRREQRERTRPRVCLRCDRAFPSTGPANRICRICHHTSDHEGLAGGIAC
jgi:hypothetical protein